LNNATVATLGLLVCLPALAIDVNLPVLPLVADDLDTRLGTAQLVVSCYLAGHALGQIPCGLLADRFGRVPVRNAGLLLFAVASLACGLAGNIETLLIARFVQGLGGAAGPVLARASIRDLASGQRMAHLMSMMVTLQSVTTLLAPIAGSLLGAYLGWRSTFFTGLLLGALVLAISRRHLPATLAAPRAGASALQQLSSSVRSFFGNFQCVWASLLVAVSFAGFMTIHASIAAIITDVYRFPPVYVGPIFALAVIAYLAASMLNRRWLRDRRPLQILGRAMALFAVAALLTTTLATMGQAHILWFLLALMLYTSGVGIIQPNASSLALEPVPQIAGFGASIMGTVQIGAAAVVSSLAATFYNRSIVSLTATLAIAAAVTLGLFLAGRRRTAREHPDDGDCAS